MGSLVDVNINTNGIAKLGELVCNAIEITAAGIKRNADAGLIAPHEELIINLTAADDKKDNFFIPRLGDRAICLEDDKNKIAQKSIKIYSLTKAGSELIRLSTVEPNQECVDYFIDIYRNNGATRITEHKITATKGSDFDFDDEPIKVHFDSSL